MQIIMKVQKLQDKLKDELANRRNAMISMRKDGKSYTEIGLEFGISRQRVFAILKRWL